MQVITKLIAVALAMLAVPATSAFARASARQAPFAKRTARATHTQNAASATLTGHVTDARTGAPLNQVLVLVEGGAQTLTDADGRFSIAGLTPGAIRVFVSVVGYALVQRTVELGAGTTDLEIPMTEGTGTYTESVTVRAETFRSAETGVPAHQSLGSADLQNLRGVLADDPLRAVQVLPGVATGDDLRSEFSVRGADFSHMNFTVEGFATPFLLHTVRAVEDRAASGSVAMINSDILEDVTLLNGGYPQRSGNRTGAELSLRLREGSRDRTQARIAVSGTSAAIVADGPIGGRRLGSWLVSARKSYLDLLLDRISDDSIAFGFADAQGKLVFDATTHDRLELAVIAGRSQLEEALEEIDANDLATGRNASVAGIASWRRALSRVTMTAKALASGNEFRNETMQGTRLEEGRTTQAGGRVDVAVALRPDVAVDGGFQIDRTWESRAKRRPVTADIYRTINDYDDAATRMGGYAQLRWTLGEVAVMPGVRADRWSLTDQSTVSPWLQAEWRSSARRIFRAAGGVYQQFTDFEQTVGTLGHMGMPPERAYHFDLSAEQRLGARSRVVLAVFNREDRHGLRRPGAETKLVGNRLVRGSPDAPYESRLDGYARGIELLVERRDPNGFSGWFAYSYGRNRYVDTVSGESFWGDLDQRHAVNAWLLYRLSARTSVSGKVRFGSNFPAPGYYREEGGRYYVASERNELRAPAYTRLDVRANRTFNWSRKRLTLFAEVMNVFNRDNVRFNPPAINTLTREARFLFEEMIPIVPSAGVLIEF